MRDGILLEDSKTVLHWGATRDEAWRTAKPNHYNLKDDDTRIKWEEHMLGGLPCGLLAYLPDSTRLDHVTLWMRVPENTYPREALYQYCRFFDHLFTRIGNPTIRAARGFYAPLLTWEHQGCILQLYTGERHGDFTTLEISHGRPPRFK